MAKYLSKDYKTTLFPTQAEGSEVQGNEYYTKRQETWGPVPAQ